VNNRISIKLKYKDILLIFLFILYYIKFIVEFFFWDLNQLYTMGGGTINKPSISLQDKNVLASNQSNASDLPWADKGKSPAAPKSVPAATPARSNIYNKLNNEENSAEGSTAPARSNIHNMLNPKKNISSMSTAPAYSNSLDSSHVPPFDPNFGEGWKRGMLNYLEQAKTDYANTHGTPKKRVNLYHLVKDNPALKERLSEFIWAQDKESQLYKRFVGPRSNQKWGNTCISNLIQHKKK
jgi:hypothetical protein